MSLRQVGTGKQAASGNPVSVHYTGRLETGSVFDSSKKAGRSPFEFRVGGGEVIRGWDEGVAGMKEGGKRLLIVPPHLGYGSRGVGYVESCFKCRGVESDLMIVCSVCIVLCVMFSMIDRSRETVLSILMSSC